MSTMFTRLSESDQAALHQRVLYRQIKFLNPVMRCDRQILLVGDRPAPDAPLDPDFHFTPFGALRHSSLYLNLKLHSAGIQEERLSWVNSRDAWGEYSSHSVLLQPWILIIALGGAAEQWLKRSVCRSPIIRVPHPAAWKRFHASEEYQLIPELVRALGV